MRILHVVSALNGGGVEKTISNILPSVQNEGYSFDFVVLGKNKGIMEDDVNQHHCNIYHITPKRTNYLRHINEIKKLFRKEKYDVVHCHLAEKGFWFYYYASKYCNKVIMHTHGCWNDISVKQRRKKNLLLKLCSRKVSTFCSCSINSAKYVFENEYQKAHIIKNSFEIEKFIFNSDNRKKIRDKFEIADDEIVIGIIARLSSEKNHILAVNLLNELRATNTKYKLLCVGDGPCMTQLKQLIFDLNLTSNVLFPGNCSNVEEYYSAFDIYVQPSIHEGFGMSLVEAQINGLNCIVSQYITDEAIVLEDKCTKANIHSLEEWVACARSININNNRDTDIEAFSDFSVDEVKKEYIKLYSGAKKECYNND